MNRLFSFYHTITQLFSRRSATQSQKTNNQFITQRAEYKEQDTEEVTPFEGSENLLFPLDENLLERCRTQWQFGDWQSLAQLKRETIENQPDRAKLALLAAAGLLQTDQINEAREFIRLAKEWGVSKALIARMLIAGVHNNLGRAAAIADDRSRSLQHFHSAMITGTPGAESRLLVQARISHEYQKLGLSPIAIGSMANAAQPSMNLIKPNS